MKSLELQEFDENSISQLRTEEKRESVNEMIEIAFEHDFSTFWIFGHSVSVWLQIRKGRDLIKFSHHNVCSIVVCHYTSIRCSI